MVQERGGSQAAGKPAAPATSIPAAAGVKDPSIDFLSSARIFAAAVRDGIEAEVLRKVAGDKLTYSQVKLLYLVAHTDGYTIGDAARFLKVSNAAASKTVEKLVRRRLLRRSEIQADRRVSHLSLTETGQKLLESYEEARAARAAEVFGRFTPGELRQTSTLLEGLAAAIVGSSVNPDETCMQCEVYFRDECKFGDLSRRVCFYQRHKSSPEGQPDSPAAGPIQGEGMVS
jgi:DNA-binding MarR family transcriptional regulator